MLRFLLVPLLSTFILAGCTKQTEATGAIAPVNEQASPKAPEPPKKEMPPIDTRSPDMALKSWWRHLEAEEVQRAENCAKANAEAANQIAEKKILLGKLVTPEILGHLNQDSSCIRESHDREILEVKVESDTRAVIRAQIKLTTPVPEGVTLDKADAAHLKTGVLFRYTLEKDEMGWKISRVDKYETLMGYADGKWEKVYKPSKPYFSTFIHYQ